MDYNIIDKEELYRALSDIMPEFNRIDEVEKGKTVDKIAETLGSKSTLSMLFMMVKMKVKG